MLSSRGSSNSFVPILLFLSLYCHCGGNYWRNRCCTWNLCNGVSFAQAHLSCQDSIVLFLCICVLTFYTRFIVPFYWLELWLAYYMTNSHYILRILSRSPSFFTLFRRAGIKAQNWDSHCLCLCFISLSADHQESKQLVMKFALQTI